MPRPIIGLPQADNSASFRSKVSGPAAARTGLAAPQLRQVLRRKRSRGYVEAYKAVDAGVHQSDREAFSSLLEAITNEFPELGVDQLPLGVVGRCYLGTPYEVHVCSAGGEILEHFETSRPMPPTFERARALALHPAYAFVEVYPDALRAVAQDGSVSVIES
ncbi:MAG TPA: hypothetical protein VKB12_08560 [Pyrinomonadaceae bacterium]|nr:hypothetical protein [Pyrinomonadaceae bacterium]